jgi:phosphatidylglycerophosphate synthase
MLDDTARRVLGPSVDRVGARLARLGVSPIALSLGGLVLGLAAAVAAGFAIWALTLVLWPLSRVFDLLDGAVARAADRVSERSGWVDLVADFTVYGGFVVGCGIGQPDARLACLVLLGTYYVNGTVFLAFSSAAQRLRWETRTGGTFHFQRGLAEGTETVVVHTLMVALPGHMALIAWAFAAVVGLTILHRVREAWRVLPDRPGP